MDITNNTAFAEFSSSAENTFYSLCGVLMGKYLMILCFGLRGWHILMTASETLATFETSVQRTILNICLTWGLGSLGEGQLAQRGHCHSRRACHLRDGGEKKENTRALGRTKNR